MAKPKTLKTQKEKENNMAKIVTKEYKFVSKTGEHESKMGEAVEGCKASSVLFNVLKTGDVPENLKLQYAPSYNAHFINRKGRNALGFFSTNNLLIVNGIEPELREKGYDKDLVHPQTSKKYWGIRLADKDADYIKKLVKDAAMILGFPVKDVKAKIKGKARAKKKVAKKVATATT